MRITRNRRDERQVNMRDYFRIFIHKHSKYWYLYLGMLVLIPVAFFITLISGIYIISDAESNVMAHLLSTLTFTIISTCLLLIPNYQAAKEAMENNSNFIIIIATLLNQLITMLPIFTVVYIFLGNFISEFNT